MPGNNNGTKTTLLTLTMLVTIIAAIISGVVFVINATSSIPYLKEDHVQLKSEFQRFCNAVNARNEDLSIRLGMLEKFQMSNNQILKEIQYDIVEIRKELQTELIRKPLQTQKEIEK